MKYTLNKSPVNELVLGIQFEGPVFTLNDEIEIYGIFRNDFPEVEEAPPLPSILEDPEAPQNQRILNNWVSRKFFINKQRDRLIQIQPDRLLFNWRKETGDVIYPRFAVVFKAFLDILNKVESLYKLKHSPNQFEMSYVDHIPLRSFEVTDFDISPFFSLLKPGVPYKSVSIDYSIPHKAIGGVLNASLKTGLLKDKKDKIVVLESTCRGYRQDLAINSWFETAHTLLLDHFVSIITEKAKKQWDFREE